MSTMTINGRLTPLPAEPNLPDSAGQHDGPPAGPQVQPGGRFTSSTHRADPTRPQPASDATTRQRCNEPPLGSAGLRRRAPVTPCFTADLL